MKTIQHFEKESGRYIRGRGVTYEMMDISSQPNNKTYQQYLYNKSDFITNIEDKYLCDDA